MSYIGSPPSTQSFAPGTDTFSGTGVTTAYTLSRNVATVNDILVVVNNVDQQPSNYTVSNNILTFSTAPSSGTNNVYVRYLSTNLTAIVPQQGTVSPASLSTPNALYWDTSGNVGVGTTTPQGKLDTAGVITSSSSGKYLNLGWSGSNSYIQSTDASFNAYSLLFYGGAAERMRIDSSGNLGVGTSSPLAKLSVAGDLYFQKGSSPLLATGDNNILRFGINQNEYMRLDTSGCLLIGTTTNYDSTYKQSIGIAVTGGTVFRNPTTGTHYPCAFQNPAGTFVGSIVATNTNTAYGTTSDYRLKENVQPMVGALDKVALLKPCTYKWKSDGSDGQGFIAHELAEVVPDAVVGEKDAVNENGSIKPQGIDTSFLVATLTAAIQEQQAMIEELKTKVAALEAR